MCVPQLCTSRHFAQLDSCQSAVRAWQMRIDTTARPGRIACVITALSRRAVPQEIATTNKETVKQDRRRPVASVRCGSVHPKVRIRLPKTPLLSSAARSSSLWLDRSRSERLGRASLHGQLSCGACQTPRRSSTAGSRRARRLSQRSHGRSRGGARHSRGAQARIARAGWRSLGVGARSPSHARSSAPKGYDCATS